MEQNLTQNVDTLFSNMENFAQNEGLIGKAVTQGDKTFMPVLSVTLGYGGGDTKGKASQMGSTNTSTSPGYGGAVGLGAKLSTEAVIIIDKENVSLVHLSGAGSVSNQVIEKIPEIMSNFQAQKQATTTQ